MMKCNSEVDEKNSRDELLEKGRGIRDAVSEKKQPLAMQASRCVWVSMSQQKPRHNSCFAV